MFAKIQRIHFVGIGGIGMSGIAEVLLNLGYRISGSDLKQSSVTDRLKSLGAVICEGHRPENVSGAEVIVISSAIQSSNPEVEEAHRLHLPVIQRAEMLAELMRLKYGIAIGGMHGKTTTTSMIAAVLAGGGLDPTVVVGGRVDAMGSNARLGRSQYLVAEADESDRSFLKLSPIIAIVTNIDREHMDCYRNLPDIKRAFVEFMDRVPFYGIVVACNDDPMLRTVLPKLKRRMVSYGTRKDSDFRIVVKKGSWGAGRPRPAQTARAWTPVPPQVSFFSVTFRDKDLGEFRLHVPGMHNVLNATGAIAVGVGLDIPVPQIQEALENFRGVDRRFQVRGQVAGITVIDDYGHHPTEIRATLAAAKQCGYRKIHVIFQPHRYTRTRDLMNEFATAFRDADTLQILDIYAASEQPIEGITAEVLASRISAGGNASTKYARSFEDAVDAVASDAQDGDMILTLGAGSVSQLPPMLLEKLASLVITPVH
jgi:UDP-N-acetylmuramate--alanine ligase